MKKTFIILLLSITALIDLNSQWKRLINKPTFECWANPKNFKTLFAGGSGRVVYRSYDEGKTWDTLEIEYRGGSSRINNLIVHPNDTNVVICGGLVFGDVRRSTNHGNDWSIVLQATWPIALNGKAMTYRRDNPDIMYIGEWQEGYFYLSTDRGATWDSISRVHLRKRIPNSSGVWIDTTMPVEIASIGIRPDSSDILFVNTVFSEVLISNDGGYTWKLTDTLQSPTSLWLERRIGEITRMAFNPTNPMHGYAVITYLDPGESVNGGLHKTTDGGYNWFPIAFPDTSMWAVAVRQYGNDDEVFIGGYTEFYAVIDSNFIIPGLGIVRRSQDGGKTWFSYDKKMDWWNDNPRNKSNFNAMFLLNENKGYFVGDLGIIFKMLDGYTPINFSFFTWENLHSVYFIDDNTGYIGGDNGLLLKTTNGSFRFDTLQLNTKKTLKAIFFNDSLNGFVCGSEGLLLKTTDAGHNWVQIENIDNIDFNSIHFPSDNVGYMAGKSGYIYKTTDAGLTWILSESGTTLELKSIRFINDNKGFAVGVNGTFLKTTNGGLNWISINLNKLNNINCIHFSDQNTGYIVGSKGLIFKTSDGGENWVELTFDTTKTFNTVNAFTQNKVYIAGNGRYIYRSSDGGNNWSVSLYGIEINSNVWSLRFWGEPGNEKLYMATEAGLFVLDDPSPVQQDYRTTTLGNLNITILPDRAIFVKYIRNEDFRGKPLKFRISDILGNIIYEKSYLNYYNDIFENRIESDLLIQGFYICEIIDGNASVVQKIIY
jgi:photosystem II stability/assembly factor-like uncharacterized protein